MLEDVATPADNVPLHESLRDADGVLVDVWEMFLNVPVRRRAEAARHPTEVLDATRDVVVALSLANPYVAFTLQGSNGVAFYEATARKPLSVDMIQAAFGVDHGLEWQRLKGRSGLLVDGFVARRGYTTSAICLVSLDGVPVKVKGWIHKAVQRAWKAYVARRAAGSVAGNHKFPAYVLNCRRSTKASERMLARETISRVTAPSPQAENEMISVVHAALHGVEVPHGNARTSRVDSKQLSLLASARKRRPSSMEGRFADALVCKRPRRKEASIWASQESRCALIRPLSEGSVISAGARLTEQERQRTMRLCIGRPSSALGIELACKKSLPGWSNPCFRGRAFVSRKASSSCEDGGGAHYMFLKRSVTIERDTIPNLRIVGQVDRKFIVVVDADSVMYAVDQHAASERYMYETLLKQATASKIQSATVSPPKKVTLSHKQRATCMYHSGALLRWGWQVRLDNGGKVEILGAPSLKKVGVVLDGEEHLRSYLDSLGSGTVKHTTPRPVLEAVASAACHSAVRFGDVLSSEQCRSIVGSLAECGSPFICAHGRPSIVPLAVFEKV